MAAEHLVPCYACGRPMAPGVSWHEDHDARCPAEQEIDRQLGIDSAERDRLAAERVKPLCGQDTREPDSRVTVACALPAGHAGPCRAAGDSV